jgi:sarcosine oxidase subunit beta
MPHSDILVVGGGAMGLSIAYNLAKKKKNVRVLESSYLNAGSTGRNVGIIRERLPHADEKSMQALIKLARQGAKMHETLTSTTGINTFYRKSGRLSLAKTEEELDEATRLHELYKKNGINEVKISPSEIEKKWKYIDVSGVKAGFYTKSEAMAHPFGLTWAYVEALKKMGVTVEKETKAFSIKENRKEYLVDTNRGDYTADKLVVTAGMMSDPLLEPLGYYLNMRPVRKEMVISEPVRPFFGPTIDRPMKGYVIAQTMRGEILGSIGERPPGFNLSETTSKFLNDFADETLSILPSLKDLRIIRQWMGITEKTKDEIPMIGKLNDDLYLSCGFQIYGITMAPAVGKLLGESIAKGEMDPQLEPFNPTRFG